MEKKLNMKVTYYLDDFLFVAVTREQCNNIIDEFLDVCKQIGCPVFRASQVMIFLGILLDGRNHVLAIPEEKSIKALTALNYILDMKKIMIKSIWKLTRLLNFLQKAIVLGRTFTRRLYDKLKFTNNVGQPLKHYHHVKVDQGTKK